MALKIESGFVYCDEHPVSTLQLIEVDILRQFVNFCEEHGLRYYLVGGTLIGAVRHQGFVPWDDDMDVAMPRKDFERFRELTADGRLGDYKIRSIIHTPALHARPFDRIVDERYMTRTKVVDQPLLPPWLDVHALDGLPTDPIKNNAHWNAANKLKGASKIARTPLKATKNPIKRIFKAVWCLPIYLRGPIYYAKKLNELAATYDFDESEYIAAFVAGYGRKERMHRYYFTDGEKKLWFEGILCSVPPHYDLVLKHMYGNYLQLPGAAGRTAHIKKVWSVIRPGKEEK